MQKQRQWKVTEAQALARHFPPVHLTDYTAIRYIGSSNADIGSEPFAMVLMDWQRSEISQRYRVYTNTPVSLTNTYLRMITRQHTIA